MNYDPNSRALGKILREAARYRTLRSIYGKDGLERIEIASGLQPAIEPPRYEWIAALVAKGLHAA